MENICLLARRLCNTSHCRRCPASSFGVVSKAVH